jgi:hypothetical protein
MSILFIVTIWLSTTSKFSSVKSFFFNFLIFIYFNRNNNHQSSSLKLNVSSHEQQIESDGEIEDEDSINIYSKEQNSILFENDEQISDDEQVEKLTKFNC